MVLTDRQRADFHAGIYEYLLSRNGDAFAKAAAAFQQADPEACRKITTNTTTNTTTTPLLEKKWTAIPRLQKKVLELERAASQMSQIHAHRSTSSYSGSTTTTNADGTTSLQQRRMLPRLPCTYSLQGHSGVVTCVQVHPVFTVVVSGSEDGSIKVWDYECGDYLKTLKGHTNTVNSLDFNASGTCLASCSTDLSIKLWDVSNNNTYSCIRTLRGHDHTISCIRFLLSKPETTTQAQATATTAESTTLLQGFLISASRDHTVKVWDVETGFCEQTLSEHCDWVRCLAVKEGLFCSSGNDTCIYVHDADTRTKIGELRGHEHVVESLAFCMTNTNTTSSSSHNKNQNHADSASAARDYLASGGRDRTVRLWNMQSNECLAVFTQHDNWVRAVCIHPSGNYIISAGDDRSIRVYDIKVRDKGGICIVCVCVWNILWSYPSF
jgi:platelet-activating factor acetylhydrolase IB subunit alpha